RIGRRVGTAHHPRRSGCWAVPTLPRALLALLVSTAGAAADEGGSPPSGMLDLTHAVVVSPPGTKGPEAKALSVLVEEVERRSGLHWEIKEGPPDDTAMALAVGRSDALRALGPRVGRWLDRDLTPAGAEGFRIRAEAGERGVLVAGNDPRGVLFGVGRLLREL